MTTPRDCRLHGTSIMPPFVEFDMSYEGFSCLYLPSVAPQSVSAPAMVGVGMVSMASDASVIGGIGTGIFLIFKLCFIYNFQICIKCFYVKTNIFLVCIWVIIIDLE